MNEGKVLDKIKYPFMIKQNMMKQQKPQTFGKLG